MTVGLGPEIERASALAGEEGTAAVEVLEAGLVASLGRPLRVTGVQCRWAELSSHPVERLRVHLDDGTRLKIVLKRLTDEVRPRGHGGEREVMVYRLLLAGRRFGAPELYASVQDASRGRSWLFLEDVGDVDLKHGSLAEWDAAVRRLAEFHGAYLGRAAELRGLGILAEHDGDFYRSIVEEGRRNLRRAGDARSLARFDALMRPYDALVEDLARQPRTFVHGDIFLKNLAVQPGPLVRPIDWESAGIGTPFLDLARLLDGWGPDKPRFLGVYLQELDRLAAVPVDRAAALRAFAGCEIVNILWHFRWSVEACRDEASVADLLDAVESLWAERERGTRDD
jgi:hypothetical protein